MKRLMICLLLGIAGCGADAEKQTTDPPTAHTDAEKSRPEINTGNEFAELTEGNTAILHFTVAIQKNPNDADAYYNRGVAYYNRGVAYYYRGVAYGEKKEYDKAIADFAKAKELGLDP